MSEHFTSEQLSDLRTYAAEHRFVDSACAMSLIAEVERLRAKCDELTINGFSAQLKQLDSLRTENAMLKDVVAGYAGSGQRIQDLSDDVGLLEATNKDLSAEVERLRASLAATDELCREWRDAESKRAAEVERLRAERDGATPQQRLRSREPWSPREQGGGPSGP